MTPISIGPICSEKPSILSSCCEPAGVFVVRGVMSYKDHTGREASSFSLAKQVVILGPRVVGTWEGTASV